MRFWRYLVWTLEDGLFVAKKALVSGADGTVGGLPALYYFVVESCFEDDGHCVNLYFRGG